MYNLLNDGSEQLKRMETFMEQTLKQARANGEKVGLVTCCQKSKRLESPLEMV